jgi:hypothetical protein
MNTQFKIGTFLGAILLLQIEMLFTLLIIIAFNFFGEWTDLEFLKFLGVIIGISIFLILMIGHIKTSVSVLRDLSDSTIVEKEWDHKDLSEAFELIQNPITKGVLWRFKQEFLFIKEIYSLNFKYK